MVMPAGTDPASADTIAFPFLFFVLLLMPVLGVLSWYRLRNNEPRGTKPQRYRGTILIQLSLLGFSLLVASHEGFNLFPSFSASIYAWSLAALFLWSVLRKLQAKWGRLAPERKRRISWTLPETPLEMKYWTLISVLAGIDEECAYRGVAFSLLTLMTGSATIAIVVCIVTFGVAHMSQGWRGAVGAGMLAALFHLMVAATGSLYLAIAFHVAYDFLLGIVAMRLFQQDKTARSQAAQVAESPA
jgi:membrane protease YdiL (CAAX protease family)